MLGGSQEDKHHRSMTIVLNENSSGRRRLYYYDPAARPEVHIVVVFSHSLPADGAARRRPRLRARCLPHASEAQSTSEKRSSSEVQEGKNCEHETIVNTACDGDVRWRVDVGMSLRLFRAVRRPAPAKRPHHKHCPLCAFTVVV